MHSAALPNGRGPRAKKDTVHRAPSTPHVHGLGPTHEYTHRYTLLACDQAFVTQRAPHTPGEARPLPGPCSPSLARSTHERIFGTHGRSKARRVAARRRGKSRAGPRKQAAHPLDGRARDRQAEGRHAARGCLLGAHTALEAADSLDERLELRHLLRVGWGCVAAVYLLCTHLGLELLHARGLPRGLLGAEPLTRSPPTARPRCRRGSERRRVAGEPALLRQHLAHLPRGALRDLLQVTVDQVVGDRGGSGCLEIAAGNDRRCVMDAGHSLEGRVVFLLQLLEGRLVDFAHRELGRVLRVVGAHQYLEHGGAEGGDLLLAFLLRPLAVLHVLDVDARADVAACLALDVRVGVRRVQQPQPEG
eukprot:scaffold133350_cov62-Phaeocystis_antarctica.AAC.1